MNAQASPPPVSILDPLARIIVDLSQRRGVTPVLVTPRSVGLRTLFFCELSKALMPHVSQSIRYDWCQEFPSGFSLFKDYSARWQAVRANRTLNQLGSDVNRELSIQITALIARPGGSNRQFVVGFCEHGIDLPSWATAIQLSGLPFPKSNTTLKRPRKASVRSAA
ncbi:hypothetical protein OAL35_02020 [bacterium]|nr:hypothetical protein [bacterium]